MTAIAQGRPGRGSVFTPGGKAGMATSFTHRQMLDFTAGRPQPNFPSSCVPPNPFRLRQKQAVRFACMYYPTAMMPAHAAKAGFDALWLDAEHNTWDRREIQRMIALHHLADIDCIVRTGSRNANELYHLLEDGATALMIPMVNSPEEARALVDAVKFLPLGQRGVDGASLDNDFYLSGTKGYMEAANAETFLILQSKPRRPWPASTRSRLSPGWTDSLSGRATFPCALIA